ncbi:V-type ATP synthase subunit D [Streptomyces sp. Li-HN-5-11]|uniref:V-type ATP synthase subunit D n=1 Tax=Streptomyces sp. Li-HN-5-11 TaxID=3075432 RepID=UPI0028B01E9D|nr:V-type ATP synthase subunit D [Streptomyces sp. Li-HN-5-11]WNM32126.1 V-type ATP synthase subunit D [Streptomyces sp. Li-HN-5-11]WOP39108.1 V-type ATP synthase subunit D [Streptomyces sp. Li-HN-5-13]
MSGRGSRVPVGRAGRLRLRRNLATALRGADLLERKLRLLLDRERVARRAAQDAGRVWRERMSEADTWLVRGVLLGGEGALAEAVPADRARVEVRWAALMGVRHPEAVSCTGPVRSPEEQTPPNTALAHAERAYRAAIRAATEHAAQQAAADLLAAEAARTRQRVRALNRHWIPRLRRELTAVELALEEAEHEEAVRRRWAASHGAR